MLNKITTFLNNIYNFFLLFNCKITLVLTYLKLYFCNVQLIHIYQNFQIIK